MRIKSIPIRRCPHHKMSLAAVVPRRYMHIFRTLPDGTCVPMTPPNPQRGWCPCEYHRFCRSKCISADEMFPPQRRLFADELDLERAADERAAKRVKKE